MALALKEKPLTKVIDELFGGEANPKLELDSKEAPKKSPDPEAKVKAKEVHPEASKPTPPQPVPVVREDAIIPAEMVITGNIMTKSNIKISGNIIGDLSCEGNVTLMGSVKGNITAGSLLLQHGTLEGDLTTKEDVVIEAGSALKGNISARNICSNSVTEGQIQATGTVDLNEEACVQGDIKAKTLIMSVGAKVKGLVDVSE